MYHAHTHVSGYDGFAWPKIAVFKSSLERAKQHLKAQQKIDGQLYAQKQAQKEQAEREVNIVV
jgi:hypothetical protein